MKIGFYGIGCHASKSGLQLISAQPRSRELFPDDEDIQIRRAQVAIAESNGSDAKVTFIQTACGCCTSRLGRKKNT